LSLAKALKERGVPLEPLLVFPVDGQFYVMDGHHRLAAYHTVSWKKHIPVEVFEGTFEEAHREALRRNSRISSP
jgi:ParB-like chromosome segregation protein Spo0J